MFKARLENAVRSAARRRVFVAARANHHISDFCNRAAAGEDGELNLKSGQQNLVSSKNLRL